MTAEGYILEGMVPEPTFAKVNGIGLRTSRSYRQPPDGLPYVMWGGRVFIPVEEGRTWLLNGVKRPNQRRKARGA